MKELSNPPIVVALFQLKFEIQNIDTADIIKFCDGLSMKFPIQTNSIQIGVDFENSSISLGDKSKLSTDTRIKAYNFLSKDQKEKVIISKDTFTYINENTYKGWNKFSGSVISILDSLSELMYQSTIKRTSIRFVNRFTFEDFDNPSDYFNTLITSSVDIDTYPLRQYGFRLLMDVPNSDIYTIVNHNVENVSGSYLYTFDIDVLDRQQLVFNIETLKDQLEQLRDVKNDVFFKSITKKTIELCN